MSERWGIYSLYDADDELLYVGISVDPRFRVEEHRRTQPWGHEVESFAYHMLPAGTTRREALAAERSAIRAGRPHYNIRGNPRCTGDGTQFLRIQSTPEQFRSAGLDRFAALMESGRAYAPSSVAPRWRDRPPSVDGGRVFAALLEAS